MASEAREEASPVGEQGKPKKKIRRVRTGCRTCRNRRKKCDENKPGCDNCRKISAICPGLPKKQTWERTPAGVKALASKGASSNRTPPRIQPILQHPSPASSFDFSDLGSEWDMLPYSPVNNMVVLDTCAPQYCQSYNHESYIPYQLPCLIAGIETDLHKELYLHFTEVTSRLLATTTTDTNLFMEIVISLALSSRTVMVALLSLAGSHLLRIIHPGNRQDVVLETRRLHKEAIETQYTSMAILKNMQLNSDARLLHYQESFFTTFLLLCLYESCQGSEINLSLEYLDRAREILIIGSQLETVQDDGHETYLTSINPILLDFFLYHDSLAIVTSPNRISPKPRIRGLAMSPMGSYTTDLLEEFGGFAFEISSLYARSVSSIGSSVATVSSLALNIEQNLNNWRPKVPFEYSQIAELYRVALFLWLKSIVTASQFQDSATLALISEGISLVTEAINNNEGVLSHLLFPLFVLGAVSASETDRLRITTQFQRVRAWSSFGNIDVTESVVRRMWQDDDRGLPRSWDWVRQLEARNMSLLVS
ncbi:hypothetical protein HYFRA_00007702 [Hymenoscyphus fraxineus]|uniref:Zn(2)-C6 fungal-type domain-containing protein n=1 Tax=Hymenoscyphus fraxineus TaxID=746836 RepID=A0A9N9KNZ8_9HELO|nr:hypothetical protein HYFRA_00007702 [Hymenoscyphus fraxineus]